MGASIGSATLPKALTCLKHDPNAGLPIVAVCAPSTLLVGHSIEPMVEELKQPTV